MPGTLLPFDNLHNIRDLGGIQTADGRSIRRGKLIRCGHLANLTQEDIRKLGELLSAVADFRSYREKERQPDMEIPGVEYHHFPVVDELTAGITREEESDADAVSLLLLRPVEAREYMCKMYSSFALADSAVSQYEKFLRILLQPHEKAVLWHCTAGKDRAGIGTVLVLELLGVPRGEIAADYLATREFLADDIRFLTSFIKKKEHTDSPLADESLRYLFGAEEEFLDSFYAGVENRFGSMDAFFTDGLHITAQERAAMQDIYLA